MTDEDFVKAINKKLKGVTAIGLIRLTGRLRVSSQSIYLWSVGKNLPYKLARQRIVDFLYE